MEISAKLLKFKFHFLLAFALTLIVFSHIYLAPSFVGILSYFWPLLVSTAMFLVAVVLFIKTSPPVSEAPGEKAAEGLLDFVASHPEVVELPAADESSKSEQHM